METRSLSKSKKLLQSLEPKKYHKAERGRRRWADERRVSTNTSRPMATFGDSGESRSNVRQKT